MRSKVPIRYFALLAVALSLAGFYAVGKQDAVNFSQYPGFAAYFKANPPSLHLPSLADQELLNKHRPRFFLSAGQEGPIDFYKDYIANGTLRSRDGQIISANVTREVLNAHKNDPSVVFEHSPPRDRKASPVIFARMERSVLDLGEGSQPYAFLSYHAVFRQSGLPAGMRFWQAAPLSLIADLADWHQLDHYTAATVVLDSAGVPFAMMLQQHNYHRTYLFGESAELPADQRPLIDVAIRSNELYPHLKGRHRRRAVSFIDPASWEFLIGNRSWKFAAADDITDSHEELNYQVRHLPPSDAFYTFKGFLGERRILPGRDGPPGANYKTLPDFLPPIIQLRLGYWREGNGNDMITLQRAFSRSDGYHAFARAQADVLMANLRCLRRWKQACALQ